MLQDRDRKCSECGSVVADLMSGGPAGVRDGEGVELLAALGFLHEEGGGMRTTHRGLRAAQLLMRLLARPRYDAEQRRLIWKGESLKEWKRDAGNQSELLRAFESGGWPTRIDNPFPDDGVDDVKRKLHDTIKCLNRDLEEGTISFHGDGRGVSWRDDSKQG